MQLRMQSCLGHQEEDGGWGAHSPDLQVAERIRTQDTGRASTPGRQALACECQQDACLHAGLSSGCTLQAAAELGAGQHLCNANAQGDQQGSGAGLADACVRGCLV